MSAVGAGIGVLALIASALTFKACDIPDTPAPTGREWCNRLRSSRPLWSMAHRVSTGGRFPDRAATTFLVTAFDGPDLPPRPTADADAVLTALTGSRVQEPSPPHYEIPASKAAGFEASALRLDAYCNRQDP